MKFLSSGVFFFLISICCPQYSAAQQPQKLKLGFNSTRLKNGDTLNFELSMTDSSLLTKTATAHLYIEEIKTGRKWHYIYPFLNGYLNAKMTIDSALTSGNYAFNFCIQKYFFRISGEITDADKKEHVLNYVLMTKDKDPITGILPLDVNNFFKSDYMLFQDSAYIIFNSTSRKSTDLKIKLVNELDSSFTSLYSITDFVSIYNKHDSIGSAKPLPSNYQYSNEAPSFKTIMPEVVVNAQSKKLIDDFQKDNVSGLFSGIDGTIIDGLESDEIAKTNDLFTYLTTKVAGLGIKTNEEGTRELIWRKHHPDFYINEIKADIDQASDVIPSDIAMIKIFEPGVPVSFGSAQGGTIAIYLKNGAYGKRNKPSNNFKITGYTGLMVNWE